MQLFGVIHSQTSGTIVDRPQRLCEIFESNLLHSLRNKQQSWRNVSNSLIDHRIQDGGGRSIEFRNISGLDEDISIVFGERTQNGDTKMTA